jgi:DNA-damage-inducible protein J
MAQISLRVDDDLKRSAERTLDDIGLSMSADSFYSKDNIAELERRVEDIRSGKSTLKEHDLIEVE